MIALATDFRKFDTKVNEVELDLTKMDGYYHGDVTIRMMNGDEKTWTGQHGAKDFEEEFGFVIDNLEDEEPTGSCINPVCRKYLYNGGEFCDDKCERQFDEITG